MRARTVPQHRLLAAAFRMAWYARHLAHARQISLERTIGWLATMVVYDDLIEEMRDRLIRLHSGVDLGNGAGR